MDHEKAEPTLRRLLVARKLSDLPTSKEFPHELRVYLAKYDAAVDELKKLSKVELAKVWLTNQDGRRRNGPLQRLYASLAADAAIDAVERRRRFMWECHLHPILANCWLALRGGDELG